MVVQIIDSAIESRWGNQMGYRSNWLPGLSLGDILWHQAIATNKHLYEERRERIKGVHEKVLYDLLGFGTSDFLDFDRPWDIATWSGRYSAAIADQLWSLLEEERSEVS